MTIIHPSSKLAISTGSRTFDVTIKPMLFAGSTFYPHGGWEDFRGYFDTIEDAKKWLQSNSCEIATWSSWAHIVVNSKIVMRCYFDIGLETWSFEEVKE